MVSPLPPAADPATKEGLCALVGVAEDEGGAVEEEEDVEDVCGFDFLGN